MYGKANRKDQDQTYEKTLLGQTNFEQTLPEPVKQQAKLAVRDEYTFDFLELGEEHSESEKGETFLLKEKLQIPPLNEQKRIVAKIEKLQAQSRRAREALETIPDLLEQLRQSILSAAFKGDLTRKWRKKNPAVEPASELLKRIRIERRERWAEAELDKHVLRRLA